ncbi:response regulator [Chitinophaga niabensis]|uniref:response regulator n=1 Tax=Chitinophaga niabensis TaxID=536979 RepID=UPI0031BA2F80
MANCLLATDNSLVRKDDFKNDTVIKSISWDVDVHVDVYMDNFIKNHLQEEYTNIFVPLSIGNTITDFLGLRFAMHIRTAANSLNQLSNIIIYGMFTQEELPKDNEFLPILFTKGIILTDYSIDGIAPYLSKTERILKEDQLQQMVHTVPLQIPENYFDSHSIANIWGLFQIFTSAGIDFTSIPSIQNQRDKLAGIYFKWLLAQQKPYGSVKSRASTPINYQDVLLIDDEAARGWKDALEFVFGVPPANLTAVSTLEQAIDLLDNKQFQLIFLDLRLNELDHTNRKLEEYGGHVLLTEHIRKDFHALNFATPIILLTASNKAWNISEMMDKGVDEYYIKAHPEQSGLSSKYIYERLLNSLPLLTELEVKRKEIWKFSLEIEQLATIKIGDSNIKTRIAEKLKIGYGTLFRKSIQVEKDILIFNNEILAYIIFWSVLEEISHDFYDRSTPYEWTLKDNNYSLQWTNPGAPNKVKSKFPHVLESINNEESKRKAGLDNIPLSQQIAGILRYQLMWTPTKIIADFSNSLNDYRNEIDYIHSSSISIYTKRLVDNQDSTLGYYKCIEMLTFLKILLT